jgi:hypothetical protein
VTTMSTIAPWQCLRVEEFVEQCNWKNLPPQTSAKSIAQRRKSLESWRCLTAQDFFALSNWSGKAISADDFVEPDKEQIPFSMTLVAAQFWQCFNWTGEQAAPSPQKIVQVLEDAKEAIAEVEEFTLNNLSQLF